MTSCLIAFVILLVSHLSVDRDFPAEVKTVAYGVFGVISVLYIIFGLMV